MSATTIHHNPGVWGDDHEIYYPEWFLEGTTKFNPNYASFLMHLGQGNRQCIGRTIAMMSMYKIVVSLLKHYEIELAQRNCCSLKVVSRTKLVLLASALKRIY
jgi:cytochrome P450